MNADLNRIRQLSKNLHIRFNTYRRSGNSKMVSFKRTQDDLISFIPLQNKINYLNDSLIFILPDVKSLKNLTVEEEQDLVYIEPELKSYIKGVVPINLIKQENEIKSIIEEYNKGSYNSFLNQNVINTVNKYLMIYGLTFGNVPELLNNAQSIIEDIDSPRT